MTTAALTDWVTARASPALAQHLRERGEDHLSTTVIGAVLQRGLELATCA